MTAESSGQMAKADELATPRGPKLEPSPELLFRLVPHAFIDNGVPTDQAFKLHERDRGLLSVAREKQTSVKDAFDLRLKRCAETKKKPPAGIWAVSVEECKSACLDAYEDPRPDDPAHGCIDFRALVGESQSQKKLRRAKEKELLDFAIQRRMRYPPAPVAVPAPEE